MYKVCLLMMKGHQKMGGVWSMARSKVMRAKYNALGGVIRCGVVLGWDIRDDEKKEHRRRIQYTTVFFDDEGGWLTETGDRYMASFFC